MFALSNHLFSTAKEKEDGVANTAKLLLTIDVYPREN